MGEGTPLSEQDIVYLDLLGNRNTGLDLGDFLGWVEATGGSMTAEEMTAVLQAVRAAATGNQRDNSGGREEGGRP